MLVGGRRLKKNYQNVLELSKIAYRLGLRRSRLDCPLMKHTIFSLLLGVYFLANLTQP